MQTLTLTDVATGWTECAPLLFREQRLLSEVMTALCPTLPFSLLGFDTYNDSVFMNETIKGCCEAAQVEFTRSRPYRKNDQANVEQKNGAIVRRMVGYRRYTGIAAAAGNCLPILGRGGPWEGSRSRRLNSLTSRQEKNSQGSFSA